MTTFVSAQHHHRETPPLASSADLRLKVPTHPSATRPLPNPDLSRATWNAFSAHRSSARRPLALQPSPAGATRHALSPYVASPTPLPLTAYAQRVR